MAIHTQLVVQRPCDDLRNIAFGYEGLGLMGSYIKQFIIYSIGNITSAREMGAFEPVTTQYFIAPDTRLLIF